MRRAGFVAALSVMAFVFAARIAAAQSDNVYFGYSYYNTNGAGSRASLNGWEATVEGKVLPVLGVVADITGEYGSLGIGQICPVQPLQPVGSGGGGCSTFNVSAHEYNVLFGPRVGTTIGKFRPFAEFEVGVTHAGGSSQSSTSFATAFGGGLDYKVFHAVAWRLEADYVHTSLSSTGQNSVRISTGIVLRF
jgi:opacity protein-like surface antigen